MGRNDAIVGVGRGDQDGRIAGTGPDIVQGRVSEKVPKICLDIRTPKLLCPKLPTGVALEPQHVQDADTGNSCREQVGPLIDDRSDQQPAVGFALNGQPVRRCNAFALQEFAGGDEVIEGVLLLLSAPGIVPSLSVFSATTNVRDGVDAAL